MLSFTRGLLAHKGELLGGAVTLAIVFCLHAVTHAQGMRGANTAGTAGNEVIQGRIHFPAKYPSAMRPVIKLQSTSSSELSTVADADGNFSFTHLRPDSYTILVDGGDEYENARETVAINSPGPVPAQGNPSQYADPSTYQVHIYLQPKSAYEIGVRYLKLGQASKAAEALAEAVKLGPENFAARLNYGIALLNLKRFVEAEKQLRQALHINNAAATAHYYLGLALLSQHQFEPAESQFEVSIKNSNDQIAQAHKYLGGIYWRNKEYKRAADELERYIALDPQATDRAKIHDTIKDLRSKN